MILRSEGHRVPKDGRTLLKTPRSVPVVDKCGGQYVYFGIESGIVAAIAKISEFYCTNSTVELIVNVDGVPIHKPSSKEFWPIQCSIFRLQHDPFLVAILVHAFATFRPQGRLLQSAVGRSTKVCYRQVAAGHERCSASCERHEEVRPRLDTPASL